MASTQALSAAAQDRKARLAQLKSLKRKHVDTTEDEAAEKHADIQVDASEKALTTDTALDHNNNAVDATSKYLSGRNYDPSTRGARLGFEHAPSEGQNTLEQQAAALAAETKRQAETESAAPERPLDLFQLQPKKPNWDLRRDLERKLETLNVRTTNAINRMVRERIAGQQKAARARGEGGEEAVGIDGTTLVEATNLREQEEEAEARREREEDDALLDGR